MNKYKKYNSINYTFKKAILYLCVTLAGMFYAEVCFGQVSFKDARPSSDWRYGDIVVCSVTVEGYNSDTDTVSFRTANETVTVGSNEHPDWGSWNITDAVESGENRFKAAIPEDLSGGENSNRFYPGEENFIQWVWEKGSTRAISDHYRIRIHNQKLEVIQPRSDIFSTVDPVFEVSITGGMQTEDLKSATFTISGAEADKTFYFPEDNNFNFDPVAGILTYRKGQDFLQPRDRYTFSATVTDGRYVDRTYTSITFTAGRNMITEFVNFPNPFNPDEGTVFRYVLDENAKVTINIYDTGRTLIKTLIKNQARNAGLNNEEWDGRSLAGAILANGVYYAEIIADNGSEYRKYIPVAILAE